MSDPVVLKFRVWGGETGVTAKLAPKLGPLGVPAPKVAQEVAKATEMYKGYRATCQITVQNREFKVEVLPSSSTLLIEAMKPAKRERKKEKNVKRDGNLEFSNIVDIAKKMRHKSCARTLTGTVLEILGTAQAMGAKVDGQDPKAIQKMIKDGSRTVE